MTGTDKRQVYEQLYRQAASLFEGQRNLVSISGMHLSSEANVVYKDLVLRPMFLLRHCFTERY